VVEQDLCERPAGGVPDDDGRRVEVADGVLERGDDVGHAQRLDR